MNKKMDRRTFLTYLGSGAAALAYVAAPQGRHDASSSRCGDHRF